MFAKIFRFAIVFAFAFSTLGAWGWEAVFSMAEKDGSGQVTSVLYKQVDGGTPIRLSDPAVYSAVATWSPDGKEIVFAVRKGAEGTPYEIHVMDSDGRNVRSLGLRGVFPVVSQHYIGFNVSVGNRTWCRVVQRDGSGVPVDIGFIEGFPAISPNETRVAFHDGSRDIVVANIDGTGARPVVAGERPSFVDDDVLVYERGRKIYIYNLRTETESSVPGGVGVYPYAVDGWIVFSGAEGWTAVRPDGSEKKVVIRQAAQNDFRVRDLDESPRPVVPRGKAPLTWGQLKRQ